MERDTFMTAEDAKSFGLIDEVVTNGQRLIKMFNFKRFVKEPDKRLTVGTNFVCNQIG